ncbi:MAG: hypothetical protein EBT47_13690, partial [Chloroflexi bacterium]|nr:hypothetical protein [Chloroflexota bacterium]
VERAPQDGQFRWDGKAIVFTRDGLDGLHVDQAVAVRTIMQAASEDSRDVVIPVTIARPTVSSSRLASMGIKDLVGVGSSKYSGSSPERANNVKVAAGKLHHTLIQPGAVFSFLESLGPITTENGYLEGLTIQGDATVPGIGGGVCQISTTMFRAAFWGGLPIIERHQHAYRVTYYEQDGSPVGFDAAVYDPGVDFRFKNDTGSPLLVHVTVDEQTKVVTFRLFGEVTGREIKLTSSRANERPAPDAAPDVPDPHGERQAKPVGQFLEPLCALAGEVGHWHGRGRARYAAGGSGGRCTRSSSSRFTRAVCRPEDGHQPDATVACGGRTTTRSGGSQPRSGRGERCTCSVGSSFKCDRGAGICPRDANGCQAEDVTSGLPASPDSGTVA